MNRPVNGCACSYPCNNVNLNSPFMGQAESVRFKRGEVLWEQGQPADSLLVVCVGALKLTRTWQGDREPIVGLAHRGHLLGEETALPGGRRTATVTALGAGKGLRVNQEELQRLLRRTPKLYESLLGRSCARLEEFSQRMEELNHGSVEERLARVLLRIGHEVGLSDARGLFVPLRLTRGDLADMVGCRVETTIRIMTRWQREGKVETHREGLILRTPTQLLDQAA